MNKVFNTSAWLYAIGILYLTGCNAVDWSIGESTLSGPFDDTNDVMTVSNAMGADVEDIDVTLFNIDCTTSVSNSNTNAIQLQNAAFTSGTYNYEVLLTLSEVEASTFYVQDTTPQGDSIGSLQFCTRVKTSVTASGLEVSFKQTKFTVSFDMTSTTITPIDVTTQEDTIEEETPTLITDYGVRLFTCDNTAAEITNAQYAQNADLYLCIHPTEGTPTGDTDEVIIQNFELTLTSGSGGAAYNPITMGASTWEQDPLSEVTTNPVTTSSRLLIKLHLVTQLFDLDPGTVETITITGTAHLEFRETRRRLQDDATQVETNHVLIELSNPRCNGLRFFNNLLGP